MPQDDGPRSALMRTYTPRSFDAKAMLLDVDFVLHAYGPAGRWASRAQVGDRLVLMGPAPGYKIDLDADWFVLAGDDTALPAIETILAELPARAKALVFVEVADSGEARELHSPATVDVQWLARRRGPGCRGPALEAALRALPALPPGPGRIYVGCESIGDAPHSRFLGQGARRGSPQRGGARLLEAGQPEQPGPRFRRRAGPVS